MANMAVGPGLRVIALAGSVALVALTPAATGAGPLGQAFAPRELTVLAGAGQDTVGLDAFFPRTARVRAGDTVTWQINSDEPHTVYFAGGAPPAGATRPDPLGPPGDLIPQLNASVPVPAGAPPVSVLNPSAVFPSRAPGGPAETFDGSATVSAGRLARTDLIPDIPNRAFSLRFDRPGTYGYLCLIHSDAMQGTIEVAPAAAVDVPDQAALDAAAQAQQTELLGRLEVARSQGRAVRSEPGAGGTTLWHVRAGNTNFQVDDTRITLMEFLPGDVTVKAGDTVIWGATRVPHAVTFVPTPPAPEWLDPQPQADGSWRVVRNARVIAPARPNGVFDPTQYFNSGVIGAGAAGGSTWALTFDRPGVLRVRLRHPPRAGDEGHRHRGRPVTW